eukprot:COSAG06_NODE_52745_length_304_cov_0.619512_1_plen_58_part_10
MCAACGDVLNSFEARPDADVHVPVERHTMAAWKKYVTMDRCHSVEVSGVYKHVRGQLL